MKKKHIISLILAVVALLATTLWWFGSSPSSPVLENSRTGLEGIQAPIVAEVPAPALSQSYTNDTYHFAVSMPDDFKASELPNDVGGKTILLQDSKGQGIQIYVTPYPDDTHILTADDVHADIPDMSVEGAQEVPVGNEYKGVAFKSNNEAFGGDSREVWFVFRANLYQISTYARFDPLLKAMFGTWQFK